MKYLFLLYADEARMPAPGSTELQQQVDAYGRYYDEVSSKGLFQSGDPVQPSSTATTVRVRKPTSSAAPTSRELQPPSPIARVARAAVGNLDSRRCRRPRSPRPDSAAARSCRPGLWPISSAEPTSSGMRRRRSRS